MLGNEVTLGQALTVTVFSMGVVFASLIIIAFILDGFKSIFTINSHERTDILKASENTAKAAEIDNISSVSENEYELIAVITATFAAVSSLEARSIRIQSINRIYTNSPVWFNAGIQEQMHNRL